MERRTFIKTALAGVAGIGAAGEGAAAQAATLAGETLPSTGSEQTPAAAASALPRVSDPGELRGEMLYRKLGTTGETVSAIGLGGSHIGKPKLSEAEAVRLMHEAIDRGITFLDNSWDYNEGQSELRMGKALAEGGYRNKVFLMTKIDGRTREAAASQLDDSLKRLKVDHLDLVQFHEILRFDDPDRVFAEGGALDAVMAARKAGKVRYVGFTGHKDPRIHLYMLEVARKRGFHFDTVQMPLNVMDAHFRSFGQLVAPVAVREGIGILGMKALGDTVILKSGTASAVECLTFSLSLPVSVLITGIDDRRSLDQAFAVAKGFKPLTEPDMVALLTRTQAAAADGRYELFKTTAFFDTTAKHPDFLGGQTTPVLDLAPIGNG
ncbi:aldo/keto reductase [Lichenibacterium ramalinae]|uniref:Aldo/keto reductase n=1 Tax=Lichenibacterium ramalinae TaxID=2316527 RepID=A0A4Q2REL8_9HYPH|nr:aldo/keto reductase [Lichenibacterium ramalinae]RYB06369.1 aldo/keto reductase [Lichenibacterium ramalinae]